MIPQRLFSRNDALSREISKVRRDLEQEAGLKIRYLRQAGEPLQGAWDYTANAVTAKYNAVARDVNQAYRRNEFYMKDIHEAGQEMYNEMR